MEKSLIYRTVAFVAGFVLMTFELVAARLLAPTIGTSIFVWTNVLGVIMAALALGYWLGGRLADKRKEELDIVWLLVSVAATIIFVLVAGDGIVTIGLRLFSDARWQGLFVALLLFAAPSLLLGMLSPYLAKFAITSTKSSGNAVAGLSTANAIGSILGTFLTGFVLFGLIGGQIILIVLAAITIGASWLVAPKELWKLRVVISAFALLAAIFPVMRPDAGAITIDTASARYIVKQENWWENGREITTLRAGPRGIQSAVYTDGSYDLVFWYHQQMLNAIARLHDRNDAFSVLVLGGGAFTVPDHVARDYPNAQVDVVEIDPELFKIAQEYFGVQDLPNLKVYAEDARSFVRRSEKTYDFILVDVFHDISMPWQFATREFGDAAVGLLSRDGVLAINMIGAQEGGCARIYDAVYGIYARHLPHRYYSKEWPDPTMVSSLELFFSWRPLPELGLTRLDKEVGVIYTDRFAPIEHLLLQCYR